MQVSLQNMAVTSEPCAYNVRNEPTGKGSRILPLTDLGGKQSIRACCIGCLIVFLHVHQLWDTFQPSDCKVSVWEMMTVTFIF